MMVQVDSVELAKLENEVKRLKAREQELLEANTALVERVRSNEQGLQEWIERASVAEEVWETAIARLHAVEDYISDDTYGELESALEATSRIATLRGQVREFHEAFGVASPDKPTVPDDDTVRLRLRLIAEEFFELLDACYEFGGPDGSKAAVMMWIDDTRKSLRVDLPAFADALADIDYVVEGTRLAFGINGKPIADAVHVCNMAKLGGTKREDGKIEKPAGWQPPDVAGCLRAQGWRG
jgi:predicted HAD superfamily Cof-like phosphohydrolase/flagellar biosynthesis regulator FlaF